MANYNHSVPHKKNPVYFKVEITANDYDTDIYLAHLDEIAGWGPFFSLVAREKGFISVSAEEGDGYVYHFGVDGEQIPLVLDGDFKTVEGSLHVKNMEEV